MWWSKETAFFALLLLSAVSCRPPSDREKKRDVDVGLHFKLASIEPYDNLEPGALKEIEAALKKALADRRVEKTNYTQDCPGCDDEEEVVIKRTLQPAYPCDVWNPKHRVCILERNIGGAVTFYLSTGRNERSHQPNITWKKEFHIWNSKMMKEHIIEPENPPANVFVGAKGLELRVSPITETDMEYNVFSATLQQPSHQTVKVYFMIRGKAVDLGFVYVGESLQLDLPKFVSLPEESMSFRWYTERGGERGNLPSNMKVSESGKSIKITELRREQEGVLACSVYTNLGVLAAKKRFMFKDLSKNNDVLESSPNHTLVFEEFQRKRGPKKMSSYLSSFLKRSRPKRQLLDQVERAWRHSTPSEQVPFGYATPRFRDSDGKPRTEPPPDESQNFGKDEEGELVDLYPEENGVNELLNRRPVAFDETVDEENIGFPRQPSVETLSLPVGIPSGERNGQVNKPIWNQEEPLSDTAAPVNAGLKERGKVTAAKGGQNAGFLRQPSIETFPLPTGIPLDERNGQVNKRIWNQQEILPDVVPVNAGLKPRGRVTAAKGGQSIGFPRQTSVETLPRPAGIPSDERNGQVNEMMYQQEVLPDIVVPDNAVSEEPGEVSAEEKIAKILSSCIRDAECSITAVCMRRHPKMPGFCKCIPGTVGVGIFCREFR